MKEKIIDKCRKLLVMSKDKSSLKEAEIALRQMNALMVKHKLEFNDLDEKQYATARLKLRRKGQWHEIIVSKIAELYFCIGAIVPATKQFILGGKPSDLEVCARIINYVVNAVISQSNLLCLNDPFLKKKSVREGMGIGIFEKINIILKEEERSKDGESSENKSLIVQMRKDELSKIESFLKDEFIYKDERNWIERKGDSFSQHVGFNEGQKMNIRGEQLENHDH